MRNIRISEALPFVFLVIAVACSGLPIKSGADRQTHRLISISAASDATCVVFDHGKVACVGHAQDITGKSGHFFESPAASKAEYLPLGFLVTTMAIHSGQGGMHACAIDREGLVHCWGDNTRGHAGPWPEKGIISKLAETQKISLKRAQFIRPLQAPARIPLPFPAKAVVTGYSHSCALLNNADVYCWGDNLFGQLGIGKREPEQSFEPLKVPLLNEAENQLGIKAKQIVSGKNHTCALLTNMTMKCWGHNYFGQLGYTMQNRNGGDPDSALLVLEAPAVKGSIQALTEAELKSQKSITHIAAGSDRTCAVLSDGRLRCWGENRWQKLGYPTEKFDKISTVKIPAELGDISFVKNVKMISIDEEHTCVAETSGDLRCWGGNSNGQLGYPGLYSTENSKAGLLPPVSWRKKDEPATIAQIATGRAHTCILLENGKMRCWGLAFSGQLGLGSGRRFGKAECMNGQPYCYGDEAAELPPADVEW